MNTKICTDIEQSEKLIEFGIDVNTADMCHRFRWSNDSFILLPCAEKAREPITDDIPAWSLAALLNILKDNIKIEKTGLDQSDMFTYSIVGDGYDYKTYEHRELIDACYEMIVKLHEKNELVI